MRLEKLRQEISFALLFLLKLTREWKLIASTIRKPYRAIIIFIIRIVIVSDVVDNRDSVGESVEILFVDCLHDRVEGVEYVMHA